jgi:transcription factor SPN1
MFHLPLLKALDAMADQEISHLRDLMLAAADEDATSNRDKMPATAKLRMLPQVMEILQKATLGPVLQSILDNNLLDAVTRWLEPLPDKSLPALNIQNAFFEALTKLNIDTLSLKESGLGKVVLFYTKSKRVTAYIQRIANELISTWSRPIIKRSASYRDMEVQMATAEPAFASARNEKLSKILERAEADSPRKSRPNAVSIPTSSFGTYTVVPRSGLTNSHTSVDMDTERRRKNAERLRSLTKSLATNKAGR